MSKKVRETVALAIVSRTFSFGCGKIKMAGCDEIASDDSG